MEVALPLRSQAGAMTFATSAPPTTPLQSPSLPNGQLSPSSSPAIPRLSLRSVATLGHTLIHGDSACIYSLLHSLAEKGKSRHEERKKRKRTKKEKQEKDKPAKDKSASWSASSIADAKAAEAAAAATTTAGGATKKGSGIKRNRSVSAQMFASADNMTVSHRDRSRSAPLKAVEPSTSCPPTPTPSPHSAGGVPRNKEAIVRSRSASSAAGLLRDAAPKKPGSAGSSPLVAHSGSSVPTAIKKTSPRHRARSSSACGTPSTSPIRRASVAPASASAQAALMLSPRTERAASLPESGFCVHGRPHGHHQTIPGQHQTRTMLTAGGHHPTCRHARESQQASAMGTIDFSSIPLVSISAAIGEDNNRAAMDAEVDAIFRGSELMATGSTSSTPSSTPRCLPSSPLASPLMSPGRRRPSFDVMHIADTMQRVSIESFDDEFKPLPFFELSQLTAGTAPVAQQAYSPYNGYHHSAPHVPVQQQQVGGLYLPPAPQFHPFAPAPQQHHSLPLPLPLSMPPTAEMELHASPGLGFTTEPSLAEGEGFFTSLLRDDDQFDELCMVIDNMEATIPTDISFDNLL